MPVLPRRSNDIVTVRHERYLILSRCAACSSRAPHLWVGLGFCTTRGDVRIANSLQSRTWTQRLSRRTRTAATDFVAYKSVAGLPIVDKFNPTYLPRQQITLELSLRHGEHLLRVLNSDHQCTRHGKMQLMSLDARKQVTNLSLFHQAMGVWFLYKNWHSLHHFSRINSNSDEVVWYENA